MSDAAAVTASPKKVAKKTTTTKAKTPAMHPSTIVMVTAAIKSLGEKSGSSLAAIKKYIELNYKGIDMERQGRFVRKCLPAGVEKGIFVRNQGKGHGASGKFRLSQDAKKAEKQADKPKPVAKKPAAKKAAKPAAKKAATKKPAAAKKTAVAKKTKTTKSPAKKAAAAKPKKAKTPAKKAKSPAKKKGPAKAKKPAAKK